MYTPRTSGVPHEFEHQTSGTVDFFQSVDVSDVAVVQRREDFRFALESCEAIVVRRTADRYVLLTASNQPLWAQTDWIGPLFLTSAAATGMAAVTITVRSLVSETAIEGIPRIIPSVAAETVPE